MLDINSRLGAYLPATIHTPHAEAGGPATMSNAYLQVRALVENSAEYQRSHHQSVLQRHAKAVTHRKFGEFLHDQIVVGLGMIKQHRTHFLGSSEQGQKFRLVPIFAGDHRVQLGALESQAVHRTLHLFARGWDVLNR